MATNAIDIIQDNKYLDFDLLAGHGEQGLVFLLQTVMPASSPFEFLNVSIYFGPEAVGTPIYTGFARPYKDIFTDTRQFIFIIDSQLTSYILGRWNDDEQALGTLQQVTTAAQITIQFTQNYSGGIWEGLTTFTLAHGVRQIGHMEGAAMVEVNQPQTYTANLGNYVYTYCYCDSDTALITVDSITTTDVYAIDSDGSYFTDSDGSRFKITIETP